MLYYYPMMYYNCSLQLRDRNDKSLQVHLPWHQTESLTKPDQAAERTVDVVDIQVCALHKNILGIPKKTLTNCDKMYVDRLDMIQ